MTTPLASTGAAHSLPAAPNGGGPAPGVTSHDLFPVHVHSSAYAARMRVQAELSIHSAVQALRAMHQLTTAAARMRLVQASTAASLSLEDTALALLEDARRLPEDRATA